MNEVAEASRREAAVTTWPRRALVGLWLLAFAIAGVSLALRWDALISSLSEPPAASESGGGAVR